MHYHTRPLTPEARARLSGGTPRRSQFDTPWRSTLQLLDRELRHLGVHDEFVLQIDVTESDLRLDGQLRANARPASDAVAIALESNKGALLFACDQFDDWRDNVRAIALGLESLRRVDRYGIVKSNEQYRGWQALPPGTPMLAAKMTVEEAKKLLHRYWAGATSEHDDWNLLFARGAKVLHPDVGGDPAAFDQLVEARRLLLGSEA